MRNKKIEAIVNGKDPLLVFAITAMVTSLVMAAFALLVPRRDASQAPAPPLPRDVSAILAQKQFEQQGNAPNASGQKTVKTDADLAHEELLALQETAAGPAPQVHLRSQSGEQVSIGTAAPEELSQAKSFPPMASPTTSEASSRPSEPLDLPIVPPVPASKSYVGQAAQVSQASNTPTKSPDSLEQVRYYVERINAAASKEGGLPISTPPPIAVPRELAQANSTPTPTPSVFHRVRNIPSHLIQTPLPVVSNASPSKSLSPAADSALADAGETAQKWSEQKNPLIKEMWHGSQPVPTIPTGTPLGSVPLGPDSVSIIAQAPVPSPAAVATAPVRGTSTLLPPSTSEGIAATEPSPAGKTLAQTNQKPSSQSSPENVTTLTAESPRPAPTVKFQADLSSSAKSPVSSPVPEFSPTPRVFEKEIRTTGEFTVRKGRAVVTFSNIPVEKIENTTTTTLPGGEDPSRVGTRSEKQVAQPAPGNQSKPLNTLETPLPTFSPTTESGDSLVEKGVEQLVRAGDDSKLAQRLASKVIAASMDEEVLTHEQLERHVQVLEILRGVKVNDDNRPNVEGLLAQDWLERTAVAAIAQQRGLAVTEDEITAEIERRKARYGQNLPDALRRAGFTEEEVRREIRKALLVDKLVEKEMAENYPEDKLRELYKANPERYQPSRRLHVREIFKKKEPGKEREAREALERIRLEIAKGASFEDFARRESESPTKDEAGDLGWIDASKPLSPRQVQALANLKPGEVSDVIELGDGYQLLKLIEIQEPKPGFEGAADVVKAAVKDHIIGLAYDEALARFDVKLRNRRLTPRLHHPEVSRVDSTATPAPSRPQGARKPGRGVNTHSAPPNDQAPRAAPATLLSAGPPASTSPTPKSRIFPFLKKRSEQ
ncbi:MAG: peptidyl-prolyl cis-trans isomerase [Candidatus Sumerlaeaceae bacterium]|nr:peptidyl-prolyl cis-trans isomerase [Candidatus Sumerlaeaceae bacterium]